MQSELQKRPSQQIVIGTSRGGLEWSFESPQDFKVVEHSAPALEYPWEVAGIGDWDFPTRASGPSTDNEDLDDPPVYSMPTDKVFLWLLVGDIKNDNAVDPATWSLPLPYEYLRPVDAANGSASSRGIAPLDSTDQNTTSS
jgi:hypothetical protein